MALAPIDAVHAAQIQAGIAGRKSGHEFEDRIATEINGLAYPIEIQGRPTSHVNRGDPATLLLWYIASDLGFTKVASALAISTGALATSEAGKRWLNINGVNV